MTDFELYSPPIPPDLAPLVAAWAGYREVAAPAFTRIESPDGRAQLIFEFGDAIGVGRPGVAAVRHRFGFFAGIDDLPTATHVSGVQAGVQVTLTTRGALALTGGDLAAFARQVVPAEDLGFARSLCDQLHAAADWPARFATVASALRMLLRARGDRAPPPLLLEALRRIDARPETLRVAALARELCVGRQQLHRVVASHLGMAPKRYASVRRLAFASALVRAGGCADLAAVALGAGYADQAHFNREVRLLAGCTPTEWARALGAPIALASAQR